jgi:hypothetical protein
VKSDLRLPVLELLPTGSYASIVVRPAIHDKARNKLLAAALAGEHPGPGQAVRVRVIEYEIADRDGDGTGELIALITTITDPAQASARELAAASSHSCPGQWPDSPTNTGRAQPMLRRNWAYFP